MPLRAVVHGNWMAQQSGNGDEMDDRAQNKTQNMGGPGSSVWAGFDSSPGPFAVARAAVLLNKSKFYGCNPGFCWCFLMMMMMMMLACFVFLFFCLSVIGFIHDL